MTREPYKKLIGKSIEKIGIEDDKESFYIKFLDGTTAKFNAEGDCCSYSWIESIDNDELAGEISSIEDIEIDIEDIEVDSVEVKNRIDERELKYYGLKITTNKGHCVVDYRNESNGYYGGSVELEYPYFGNEDIKMDDKVEGLKNNKRGVEMEAESTEKKAFVIGEKYFLRLVTYHIVGRLVAIDGDFMLFEDASWIAMSGRFMQFIKNGALDEVEPVGDWMCNKKAIVDGGVWKHPLPTEQR